MIWWLSAYILYGALLQQRVAANNYYGSLIIDIIFVLVFIILFKRRPHFRIAYSIQHILALFLGAATIFSIFSFTFVAIPFSFSDWETVLVLCLIGPIVEEFVFRFMAIEALISKIEHKAVVIFLSALLFSLSHSVVFFDAPIIYKDFITIQTGYTFILGLWWGYEYIKTKNTYHVIALHVLFNVGFWLTGYFGF